MKLERNNFLRSLVNSLYSRNEVVLDRGNFRVKGDTVDIFLAYADIILRVIFWGEEIESIESIDPVSGHTITLFNDYKVSC